MKYIFTLILVLINTMTLLAQDISGTWKGTLELPGKKLPLVFHLEAEDAQYTATWDSPNQGAMGLPVAEVIYEASEVELKMPNSGATYKGKVVSATSIEGNFVQGGLTFPLNLELTTAEEAKPKRPQEPQAPFPYQVEEVSFSNGSAGIKLAGTLTMPNGQAKVPAAILISGSGPQNRDEELLGHKPFWVLADHLSRKGIAVLRFDDRGVGESEGDFAKATSADFATDVSAAMDFLKDRADIGSIGLIGHSEGGIIAPMVAAERDDVAFIVSLAGTGIPGDELLMLQSHAIGKAQGMSEQQLKTTGIFNKEVYELMKKHPYPEVNKKIEDYFNQNAIKVGIMETQKDKFVKQQMKSLGSPWFHYFVNYDPAEHLSQVACPFLSMIGEKDLQVPPKENHAGIEAALEKASNKKYELQELASLNHLFQTANTGAPTEYAEIEETFAPIALDMVSTWINKWVK